jgi:hypothetical protein
VGIKCASSPVQVLNVASLGNLNRQFVSILRSEQDADRPITGNPTTFARFRPSSRNAHPRGAYECAASPKQQTRHMRAPACDIHKQGRACAY